MINKYRLFVWMILMALPAISFSETLGEEASRRMPPVFYKGEIPEHFVSGETVTIKWSVLGYHDSYKSNAAFFYGSGGSYNSNFQTSGDLNYVSTEDGTWSYSGISSSVFNYEYVFTPPQVTNPTNIVIRFYRINDQDEANGNPGLSLLIPGKVSDRNYDTSGRRIVKTIYPATSIDIAINPDIDSTPYKNNNPFDPNYSGQCTWFAWGRVNEITGVEIETLGNAKTWWINTSLPKGRTPLPDSIAIWNNDRQGSGSNAGHVAYVEYLDDSNIYYNEANIDTFGDIIPDCSGCGGGYDGYLKSSSKEEFEDRGNGIGKLSGFIYPTLHIKDWWTNSDNIIEGNYFDAQFKIENLGRSPLIIADSRVAIYKQSGVYLGSTILNSNTSAVLLSGDTYHHQYGEVRMDKVGNYYAQPEIKVNGEWIVLGRKKTFEVSN
jgi:surface antigen